MSISKLVELGSKNERCLSDYLEFFDKNRLSILHDVQLSIPDAVPIFRTESDDATLLQDRAFLQEYHFERYLNELATRARGFTERGGRISDWLWASQVAHRRVLALLDAEASALSGNAQSVILGMSLFSNIVTAKINQFLTEREQLDAQFRLAFDAAPTGLIIVDKEGAMRFANVQTERLFGYRRDELIGRQIEILVPPRLRQEHGRQRASYAEAPASRMMGAGRELYGLRRDGHEFPVEIGLNPSPDNRTVLAVIVDISERKRVQEALMSKMWELQRSNEDLEQFAYVASHDLQEPLRMVVSYTTLLSDRYRGKLDEKADKFIRYAVEGATRMQQLVADLLSYSRVGSQGKPLKPVNAQRILDNTVDGMRKAIEESAARISCTTLPIVNADEVQLAQLFQNLISNALKFRGERSPHVSISAQPSEEKWLFSIKDNGIGIEQEHSERIFQLFQRLHERGKYEGSGIGLTIAKKIVERHRGRIWFESQPGQGTTFFFTLPAAPRGDK